MLLYWKWGPFKTAYIRLRKLIIKPSCKEFFKSARKEGERKTRKRESKKRIVTPLVSGGS